MEPLRLPAGDITSLATFRDENGRTLLACASTGPTVSVWDPLTSAHVIDLQSPAYQLDQLVSYRDEEGEVHLAASDDDGDLWNWLWPNSEPELIQMGLGPISAIQVVADTDGGVLLVCASDEGGVFLVDPETDRSEIPIGSGTAFAIYTSEAGRNIIAIADGSVVSAIDIWTEDQIYEFDAEAHIDVLAALPTLDGRVLLATGNERGSIDLWDPESGSRINWLSGHLGAISAIGVFRDLDGQACLATAGGDAEIRLWNPFSTAAFNYSNERQHIAGDVRATVFVSASNGMVYLATGNSGGWVHIWDGITGKLIQQITQGDQLISITALRVVGNSSVRPLLAVALRNGPVRVWDPITGELVRSLIRRQERTPLGQERSQRDLSISNFRWADGRPVTASGDWTGVIRIVDPVSGRELRGLTGHTAEISAVIQFTSNGKLRLASASNDGTIRTWDPLKGVQLFKCEANDQQGFRRIHALAALTSAEDRVLLASGGSSGVVRIWDAETGALVRELPFDSEIFSLSAGELGLAVGTREGVAVVHFIDRTSGLLCQ